MRQCIQSAVCFITSPVGELKLVTCSNGIHVLGVHKKASNNKTVPIEISRVESGEADKTVEACVRWLSTYFKDAVSSGTTSTPPICALHDKANSFRATVWRTLLDKVPSGQTVSYGELAELSGKKKSSSRAVGQAMRHNPVGLIIPCHRVLHAAGTVGSYAWGRDMKAWLLQHEGWHES